MIKLLIADDSALMRKLLEGVFRDEGDFDIRLARNGAEALELVKSFDPHVVTLDVQMPGMNGLECLSQIMIEAPRPVVMISSLTEEGAEATLEAIELGAVDFVAKPRIDIAGTLADYEEELIAKVRVAAGARVQARTGIPQRAIDERHSTSAVVPALNLRKMLRTTDRIIAVGASTGGTEAIRELLAEMPADAPPIVISQHIPAAFSKSFAERMNRSSAMAVCEAQDGQQILPGHAYVAPGDRHLLVERDGARYLCRLSDGAHVNRHRPSVDVMFRSVAQNVGANAVGVLLTGMGDDGARGLKEMMDTGASTIAQDEDSSVVWGMPGSAVKIGAAMHVLPLQRIGSLVLALVAKAAAA